MPDGRARQTGVIGLAVMGENLALNIARNGYPLVVYNRTTSRTDEFLASRASDHDIVGAETLEAFVDRLERPRRIIIMVRAGAPVDAVLAELGPLLDPDDIVVDGGNSLFTDTERRTREIGSAFRYVGMGISGGEEGALHGPSLMPGGPRDAYDELEEMLIAISAKTEAGPCVTYIGPGGAGHYVKMVHNGIEYADMQQIAEAYDVMARSLGMSAAQIGEVFARWNHGKLASYLVEITAHVLGVVDEETGSALVDLILDTAEQKGTGRWTSQSALELGVPIPSIDAAVVARLMSARKEQRLQTSRVLGRRHGDQADGGPRPSIEEIESALYVAKVTAYAQGMDLLRSASETYGWDLDLAEIARIWKGGCIIRAALLDPIRSAFEADPRLGNLLLAPDFAASVVDSAPAARSVLSWAIHHGIPMPALSASIAYLDALGSERLPANLIQAQRDFFGAHTYRRIDREGVFHTDWQSGEAVRVDVPTAATTPR